MCYLKILSLFGASVCLEDEVREWMEIFELLETFLLPFVSSCMFSYIRRGNTSMLLLKLESGVEAFIHTPFLQATSEV